MPTLGEWASGGGSRPAFVFDLRTWVGVGLGGLAVLLWFVSGLIRDRQLARGQAAGKGGHVKGAGEDRTAVGASGSAKSGGPVVDDDMAEIEALLRKRGIE